MSTDVAEKLSFEDLVKANASRDEVLELIAEEGADVAEVSKYLTYLDGKKSNGNGGNLYCKVSEKGGCSLYGLQRMPVTLYVEQWERLLAFADTLREFLKENDSKLKRKPKK